MASQQRTSKEIKLDDSNFICNFGTLNKNAANVIYINGKGKVKPSIMKTDYSADSKAIKQAFDKFVDKTVKEDEHFYNDYICSCDISENGLSYGKKSHIKYSIFVKPKVVMPIEEYMEAMQRFNATVSNYLKSDLEERKLL